VDQNGWMEQKNRLHPEKSASKRLNEAEKPPTLKKGAS
jgi:hypothetical protein